MNAIRQNRARANNTPTLINRDSPNLADDEEFNLEVEAALFDLEHALANMDAEQELADIQNAALV